MESKVELEMYSSILEFNSASDRVYDFDSVCELAELY
jgi:hypothetical protein